MREDLIIQISESRTFIGGSEEQHKADAPRLRDYLKTAFQPHEHIKMVNVYNFDGHRERFSAGSEQRFNIYMGVSPDEGVELLMKEIYFADFRVTTHLYDSKNDDDFVNITDDTGELVIAKYDKKDNELYVLFNPFYNGRRHPVPFSVMQLIIRQLFKNLGTVDNNRNSWNKTQDRKMLIETLNKIERNNVDKELKRTEALLDSSYSEVRSARHQLSRCVAMVKKYEKELELLRELEKNTHSKLADHMLQIANLEKVEDVEVYDRYFVVKVPNVHAETEHGDKYHIGDFDIIINYEDSDITLINTSNQRKGFWTDNDNHPHISHNGQACFGNIEDTVAELCAQHEFYALVLSLIDFLETVNMEDSAGAYVANWKLVKEKEETEYLETYEQEPDEEEEYVTCDVSGKRILKREAWTVYWDFNEQTLEPFRERKIDKEHLGSFAFWKSIGAWVNKSYFERKYFDEDGYKYNEMELVEDHEGIMIPKELAKRAWGVYTHEEGLINPVFVYNEELEHRFTKWDSLNGEWVDADWAIEGYFFDDGKPIDHNGEPYTAPLKPIPDHKVKGVDV